MRICLLLLLYLLPFFYLAQYSSIALTEADTKKFGELSKNATLYIIINNEKEPSDAALVSAVKNYWKTGPYKFMSKVEFLNLKSKNELSPNSLYLYEWFENGGVQSSMEPSQLAVYLSTIKTGVYYLASGLQKEVKTLSYVKTKTNDLYLLLKFNLSATLVSNKDKILDGYFDLMIKYFNTEIKFCQNPIPIKDIKKEEKDGIVYFGDGLKDLQTKDILLVKEQVVKIKTREKKEDKKTETLNVVSQYNPPSKNVHTVFPEDIKLAMVKNDKQVLLYSNGMILSACDGAVVAATAVLGTIREKKDYAFWLSVVTILVSAFAIATLLK